MSLVDRAKQSLARARERWPVVDHVVRMQEHYTEVKGSQQAGGVTYFGFLSVFPVLALAFFAVGYVAEVFPDAQDALLEAIEEVLPGLVGNGANEVPLEDIQSAAGAVGLIGLAGVLYAGLGWLSSLRTALGVVFELPDRLEPSFVIGKLRDLTVLVVLGLVLLLSVSASAVLTRTSRQALDLVGLGDGLGWLVAVIGIGIGLAASGALFFLIFRLLAHPPVRDRALWAGAWLGAVGFEALKQLSGLLLTGTKGQPAFQAFGIALILLVWINYFSRVVLYAAAWAHTEPVARAERAERLAAMEEEAGVEPVPDTVRPYAEPLRSHPPAGGRAVTAFVAGSLTGALATSVRRRRRRLR
ncbi:YihY/virulence factor BrkB family protein [Nocardioides caeni]|nr:YihY/virulence factor BrkB family protein [Nocardioides caeni]